MSGFKRGLKIFLVIVAISVFSLWAWYKYFGLKNYILDKVSEKVGEKFNLGDGSNPLRDAMGFGAPRTYLLLFLNNTELRPAGGFIGMYAVVKMDNGTPQVLKAEGTETLDSLAPRDFVSEPPAPIANYLSVKRWEFRDSNWSPDFASSSEKALELYKLENGLEADNIDAVIAFTPTLMEEVLKIHGPVTAGGITFTPQNFTEKLEYEVEYGYEKRGLNFDERKYALIDMTHQLVKNLSVDVFLHWPQYLALGERMLKEKQIVAYSVWPQAQATLSLKKYSGQILPAADDYLMWVDANLGALKSDAVMERQLFYSIAPDGKGNFIASAKMKLVHHGSYDWRTTRYQDYARVFVPLGSKFVSVSGAMAKGQKATAAVDQGVENGRQWFGASVTVLPGHSGELEFKYQLPPSVAAQIRLNQYELTAQKQIGTIAPKLTLGLDFGKNLTYAAPPEPQAKHGDKRYDYVTDLRGDREFTIKLK